MISIESLSTPILSWRWVHQEPFSPLRMELLGLQRLLEQHKISGELPTKNNPHHLLWVTPTNSSQLDNLQVKSLILVKFHKWWYIRVSPKSTNRKLCETPTHHSLIPSSVYHSTDTKHYICSGSQTSSPDWVSGYTWYFHRSPEADYLQPSSGKAFRKIWTCISKTFWGGAEHGLWGTRLWSMHRRELHSFHPRHSSSGELLLPSISSGRKSYFFRSDKVFEPNPFQKF